MMRMFSAVMAVVLAGPLAAQEVQDCRTVFPAEASFQASQMSMKAYANGAVKFLVVHDGREQAADALFIAVFSPQNSDDAQRQCHLVGREVGVGYANIGLDRAIADYAPDTGLTVQVPARIYLPEEEFTNTALLSINVNQATQAVTVTQELGSE